MPLDDIVRFGVLVSQVTSLPPTSNPGEYCFLLTGNDPGLYFCRETNVWILYDNVVVAPIVSVPKVTTVDTVCSGTSFINITGAVFPMLANTRYRIRGFFPYEANAISTGLAISWNGPAAPILTRGHMYADMSAFAQIGLQINGNDTSNLTATQGSLATTGNMAIFQGIWHNGANPGNLQMRVKSEVAVANAIRILAGSLLDFSIY